MAVKIIPLINNTALPGFYREHGLSFWLEFEGRTVLYDAGQSCLLLSNARYLGLDPAGIDAVVISHGHYDHTGALGELLSMAPEADLYVHPDALKCRHSIKNKSVKSVGIAEPARKAIERHSDKGRVVWPEGCTEIFNGLFVTGTIPRTTAFEDTGGSFFNDAEGAEPDMLYDDQAVFFGTDEGTVILSGCSHSGIVNIVRYVTSVTGTNDIALLAGGMHLVNADEEKINRVIRELKEFNIRRTVPAHCTGTEAERCILKAFPDRAQVCEAGRELTQVPQLGG